MSGEKVEPVRSLQDVVARLEKLEGPCRDMDADIFAECGGDYYQAALSRASQPCGAPLATLIKTARHFAPNYTASLDAALLLVPHGCEWWAQVYKDGRAEAAILSDKNERGNFTRQDSGCTKWPAIALCIAALKARST